MLILDEMQARGHESLTLLHHAPSGLKAALAVHSTVLGPAIAGVRLREQDEELAVRGALALSESLTLKAALAGLNYGGGACVLMMPEAGVDDPHTREALFRALGRQVRPLATRAVLTEDIGVTPADIAFVAQETPATLGMNTDTSAITGYGVYRGMKAAARFALGAESMRGVRVVIMGVGAVGRALAAHLHREGAKLTVADDRPERAQALADSLSGVNVVSCGSALDVPGDILAPCGFGHSVHSADVPRLQCRLIAGGEHHPLTRRGEEAVKEAGIVYMPDFAINSAGLIAAATGADMNAAAEQVYQIVSRITHVAEQYSKPPSVVARRMAERRIELIGSLGRA
ncbi:Glu/Leu/Phe/Val dehydrogenase family protein [Deinococcus humi]|uniref:Leucine dehydrogenase n=1 Tax=Deinococcus humi TaxID=662880 RepID=A0A7W8NCN3_9DEIO|nr:Glu/Leu/Phe/Val dehydrogenase dimerization domain-containing protein [Deinococcus humi]MBB5361471.1 leucine dehydrogenase [Deinococcus humi]GGO20235.1 branched-chain amino acid dehydrogenase [Deinococcus humi]